MRVLNERLQVCDNHAGKPRARELPAWDRMGTHGEGRVRLVKPSVSIGRASEAPVQSRSRIKGAHEACRWMAEFVRFSSLDHELFVHSAFPTIETDSVLAGPEHRAPGRRRPCSPSRAGLSHSASGRHRLRNRGWRNCNRKALAGG